MNQYKIIEKYCPSKKRNVAIRLFDNGKEICLDDRDCTCDFTDDDTREIQNDEMRL